MNDLAELAWRASPVPILLLTATGEVVAANAAAIERLELDPEASALPEWLAEEIERRLAALRALESTPSEPSWLSSTQGTSYRLAIARVETGQDPQVAWLVSVETSGPSLVRLIDLAEERFGLTSREGDVVSLLAEGLSNRQIAALLEIADSTVKFHLLSILKKSGTKSRTEFLARLFSVHVD